MLTCDLLLAFFIYSLVLKIHHVGGCSWRQPITISFGLLILARGAALIRGKNLLYPLLVLRCSRWYNICGHSSKTAGWVRDGAGTFRHHMRSARHSRRGGIVYRRVTTYRPRTTCSNHLVMLFVNGWRLIIFGQIWRLVVSCGVWMMYSSSSSSSSWRRNTASVRIDGCYRFLFYSRLPNLLCLFGIMARCRLKDKRLRLLLRIGNWSLWGLLSILRIYGPSIAKNIILLDLFTGASLRHKILLELLVWLYLIQTYDISLLR